MIERAPKSAVAGMLRRHAVTPTDLVLVRRLAPLTGRN